MRSVDLNHIKCVLSWSRPRQLLLVQHVLWCHCLTVSCYLFLRVEARRQTLLLLQFLQEPDFMSSPSSRQQMMLSEESTLLLSDLMKQQLIPSESPAWKTPEQQEIISCAAPISWDHDSRYNSVSVRVQIVDRWALREIICLQRLESMLSRRRTVFYRLCSVDMKSIKLQDIFSEMDDSSKIILDFNTKGIRIFPANTRGQWVVQGAWERGAFRVMVKPSSGVFF